MNRIVSLSAAVSWAVLLGACSSSSSPANSSPGDGGSTPSDASADGAAACNPVTIPAASVPTYTSPALGQGVCASADITAFVAACAGATDSGTPEAACNAWLQSEAAACSKCLLATGSNLGPFQAVTLGGQPTIIAGLGACVLGSSGAAAASCAAVAQPIQTCVESACAACPGAAAAGCATAAEGSVCGTYISPVSAACGSILAALEGCETSLGTSEELTQAATAICGAPAGDAGVSDSGVSDAGAGDADDQ